MTAKTLTATATALYLGFSRKTFYNMLNDGRFPVLPIPGTQPRRWNTNDLDAWLAGTYTARVAAGDE